ncbi:MAG: hypothetical protein LBJ46_04260, partial [Planctomycetota bacterium]|nr:hypothetical protein [Planctomycetota bacterium]
AGARFAVRLPHNPALDRLAAPWLARPAGRPPKEGYEVAVELTGYKNPGWDREYRVVLVVVDKPGKDGSLALFPNYFFIATNWTPERMPAPNLLTHFQSAFKGESRICNWIRHTPTLIGYRRGAASQTAEKRRRKSSDFPTNKTTKRHAPFSGEIPR